MARSDVRLTVPARDAIVRLSRRDQGVTVAELAAELGVHRTAAGTQLKLARQHGIVIPAEPVRTGRRGRPALRYAYAPLPAGPTHRPVHDSPRTAPARGADVVEGTGRGKRLARDKATRDMLEAAKAAGARIERGGTGHVKVVTDQGAVSLSATPKRGGRGEANNRADLRRIGIEL